MKQRDLMHCGDFDFHTEPTRQRRWRERHREQINQRKQEQLETLAGRSCPQRCEICGRNNTRKGRLVFDHDHKTGDFRGWLCHFCNSALGFANDDPALARKWADYLEQGGFGPGPSNKTVSAVLRSIEEVSS